MSKGSFEAGLEALGAFESGRPSGDPEQYRVQNSLGFTGKYQFGEALLIDLGYYQADTFYGAGAATNLWQGTWTEKAQAFGVNSIEDFRNSPEIQEAAIRDAFEFNWGIIETALGNAGKTVDDYIGKTISFNDGGTQKSVTITPFGILAGAHLRGPYGLANLLLNGSVSYDEYGTSILRYVDEYAGYDVPADITGRSVANPPIDTPTTPTEPVTPDPVIPTSGESLVGTDGVKDVFDFTWNWGKNSVIKDFNPIEDTVDLKKFWLPDPKQVKIFDDSQGNAVIDLKEVNNQTITLEGVSKSELTANNFQGLPDANTVLNNPSTNEPTPPTNPTTPSLPTLSIDTTSVVEGNKGKSNAVFTVELSAPSDRTVTVNYNTVDGNADSLTDFVAKSGTLTFAPGETSQTISIEVNGDTEVEKSENFYVELNNAVNANILDGRGDATIINDDFPPTTQPTTDPTVPPTTPSNGRVIQVNENGADVLNFNPAVDKIDFGKYSVHSMIITETAKGVAFTSPWNNAEQVLVGISLKDLSIDNFKPIGNSHLREDVAGALAWSRSEAVLEPNTVYVRSHEVGLREVVDFNPATDKISFLYYGNRERLTINDTAEGVEISNSATNQSLVLKNVKIADLSASNFEFHFTQVREDHLDTQLGFSVTNDQIVSREDIPIPGGEYNGPTMPHHHPDGHPPNQNPDQMPNNPTTDPVTDLTNNPTTDPLNNPNNNPDRTSDYIGVDGQKDVFSFTWNWGKESVIDNFNPNEDVIDLKNFWTNYDKFEIVRQGNNTVIDLSTLNNQKIILQGVSPSELKPSNITGVTGQFPSKNNPGNPTEPTNPTNPTEPTTPSLPTLSIDDVSILEGNSGKSNAVFTVELSAASDRTVTVNYATLEDTANSRRDFVSKNGTLTFAPGETSQTISVEVKGDTKIEKTENFYVELNNAVNANILDSKGVGTILNDDRAPNTGGNSQPVVGAYYPEWAIYDRNYQVTDLPADKLTHAFYAFAKIKDDGTVGVFDSWAATDKRFDGDWNTPKEFAGNFEQLNNVKAANPHLKNSNFDRWLDFIG